MKPNNSDRLRNYSILPVIASTRRVRGNLSAIMRDCFTSFAMTTFYRCSWAERTAVDSSLRLRYFPPPDYGKDPQSTEKVRDFKGR
jgi:hypothetical protein